MADRHNVAKIAVDFLIHELRRSQWDSAFLHFFVLCGFDVILLQSFFFLFNAVSKGRFISRKQLPPVKNQNSKIPKFFKSNPDLSLVTVTPITYELNV